MNGIIDLVYELKKKCIESDTEFVSNLNISDSEYNFTKALINCTTLNSKSIAAKMGVSLSRVSRIIDNMVKKGYMERDLSQKDRREITIKLSDKGEILKKSIIRFRNDCEDKITNSLSDGEIDTLKNNLAKILELL